ncbi:MAG TPA: hypothetical protein VK563_00415 [Puia sp.]|nr:hypothetical protein [Puia sp.]
MTNTEFSPKEVEQMTRSSLPQPSTDMVGKYYKVPFLDANDPNMQLPAEIRKTGKQGVYKLTEKMEWSFIGIGLIQPV